ncbi:hypothetical protein [Frankia sp. Cr1]|uniref:hypothetical protein n=1 Tax=Frankia sp. Cr1 TaxID=3073931 RepID=UPI002AD25AD3|nr:hypothetical protein [Frankia sp. Cr1]
MIDTSAVDSARLTILGAFALARRLCQPQCFGYHATWRLFRHTGLKASPGWHTDFYRTALAPLAANRPLRILICAASDEAMLATLAMILDRRHVDIHLVDACATPLVLSATYAHRQGIALTTIQAHAPDLPDVPGPFDVAVTDGLLSLLEGPAARHALLARLASLLTPDGRLLYTTRIAGPSSVLEYDRVGRTIQAAAAYLAWPGDTRQRHDLARRILTRPARRSPFTIPDQLRTAFSRHFTHVAVAQRPGQPTLPLRLHPAALTGNASRCIQVTADTPIPPAR